MTNPIDALLAEKGVLLADGATGTNLFGMGLEAGEAPELLERDGAGEDRGAASELRRCRRRHHPHQLLRRHAPSAEAASMRRTGCTSSTSGPPRSPARWPTRPGRKVIVAGSVGPTGELAGAARRVDLRRGGRCLCGADRGPEGGRGRNRLDRDHVGAGRGRAAAEAAIRVGLPYTYTCLLRHGRPLDDGPGAQGHPWRGRWPCRSSRWRSAPIAASAPPTSWRRCST